MIININNKKISAGALALKWPSVLVACKVINGNTYIEWDEASIPAKTEAEIKSAQDAYDLYVPWLSEMRATDNGMTRQAEDLWDALGLDAAPQHTKDVHAAKKAVRASKP